MSAWVLILTLAMGVEGGVSIQTVDFATREACMAAADLWLKKGPKYESSYFAAQRTAICVPTGAPRAANPTTPVQP